MQALNEWRWRVLPLPAGYDLMLLWARVLPLWPEPLHPLPHTHTLMLPLKPLPFVSMFCPLFNFSVRSVALWCSQVTLSRCSVLILPTRWLFPSLVLNTQQPKPKQQNTHRRSKLPLPVSLDNLRCSG